VSGGTGRILPATTSGLGLPATPHTLARRRVVTLSSHIDHGGMTASVWDADMCGADEGPRATPRRGAKLGPVGADGDTIVVVEDDHNISDLVALYLRREGFRVLQADDAARALEYVARDRPKLVLVDVGLPGELDGFDLCRRLRAEGDLPVVMLTARDDEIDRVVGFELGADDYVTKPFSPRELVARVRAILRRAGAGASPATTPVALELGDLVVDTGRREARVAGAAVALTTREFDLLAHLLVNRGLALSRRQLLNSVWGEDWYGDERTVDVHVRQLRKKLGGALPLTTVWGVGYRLD
jgi:DNA-binding response OmpR family regulator